MKALLDANQALLNDAAALFGRLDDSTYAQPFPAYASGSLGQHLRHVLDHYHAVLCTQNGVVDFDSRRRDSHIESSRHAGLNEIRRILDELLSLVDREVLIRSESSPSDTVVIEARSTIKRELLFAASHATHHFALIAMLLRVQGLAVPLAFGVAPATLTYHRSSLQSAPG